MPATTPTPCEAWRSTAIYTDVGFDHAERSPTPPRHQRRGSCRRSDATGASALITATARLRADRLRRAGARAVASVYMHTAVINEYVLDTGSASMTDWVITFPTEARVT